MSALGILFENEAITPFRRIISFDLAFGVILHLQHDEDVWLCFRVGADIGLV